MEKRTAKKMTMKAFRAKVREMIKEELSKTVGNPHHDKDGQFSSKKNSRCDSTYFQDGDRDRKKGSLTSIKDTGRGKNKNAGKGRYRCYDDAALWETDVGVLIDEAARRSKRKGMDIEKLKNSCRGIGLKSIGEFLDLIDQIEKAKKGAKQSVAGR